MHDLIARDVISYSRFRICRLHGHRTFKFDGGHYCVGAACHRQGHRQDIGFVTPLEN